MPARSDNLASMTRRPRLRGQRLLLSLFITLVIAAGLGLFVVPAAMRWHMLNKLTSPDPQTRERGLNYVIRRGKTDDRVVLGAADRMKDADDANFMQILSAINYAGKWEQPPIPDGPWLRWLELLSVEAQPAARVIAATKLADMHASAGDERVHKLLAKLLADEDADARYNVLIAAAALAPHAANRKPLEGMVRRATADTVPVIAREAWLFVGLLDIDTEDPDWRSASPGVAEAMIWAVTHNRPKKPDIAVAALDDASAPLAARAMAAYSLHMSPSSDAKGALSRLIFGTPPEAVTEANQVVLWRAMLAAPFDRAGEPNLPSEAIIRWGQQSLAKPTTDPLLRPLLLAAAYRTGKYYPLPPPAPSTLPSTQPEADPELTAELDRYHAMLAAYESPRTAEAPKPEPGMPDLLAVTMLAKNPEASLEEWQRVLGADDPALRDLACFSAARTLPAVAIDDLITSLLADFDDHAKISGAVLSGLTGRQGDLLEQRLAREDNGTVKMMMRVGLWMQGRPPDMSKQIGGLFARGDIPTTTLLLALLHRGDKLALDYLLNPRGEPRLNLIELLDQRRWWRVLELYLPNDAPPFWPWADPHLEAFQVEVLRNWYLLHREKVQLRNPLSSQARG
jgi:hypothetical protein